MIKAAIRQFEKMGLTPVICRVPVSKIYKGSGYKGTAANKQYEYDHRMDEALFLDKAFVERKTSLLRNAYESTCRRICRSCCSGGFW